MARSPTDMAGRGADGSVWKPVERSRTSRNRRRLASVAILLILGSMCYSVLAAGLSRRDYGTFAFWRSPDRINYCGRRYYRERDDNATRAAVLAQLGASAVWKTVGRTFVLRPIEAPVLRKSSATDVCTMSVYVPTGAGQYVVYVLSGGP